jgi:hypothetical protein
LGKQSVKVEQWVDGERVGDPIQVEVDLAVAPLTASAAFSSDPSVPVLVSGSGQADANVVVHRPGKPDTIQPIGNTGTYSFRMPAPDQGGKYTITLGQRFDKPGGGFEETTPVTLPIDYGRGVSIVSPEPDAEHAGGKVEMTGRGTPGALVTVTEKGSSTELGTARVLPNEIWSLETTESLDAGKHTLVASQLSKGNNTTLAEVTLNPEADNVAPLSIDTPADGSTVESSSKRITFSGTGEPGAHVQVKTQTASPRTIIDTYVGRDGKWSQLGGDLNFDVNYVLDTIYTPQGGDAVRGTTRVTVTDSNPGVVQPFAFTTPQNNTSVVAPNKQVRLAGVGATGTTVTVWNYRSKDRVIGTATVGSDGTWVIPNADLNNQDTEYALHVEYTAPGAPMQSLTHTITVKAAAGVERPFEVATPGEGSTVVAPTKRVEFTGAGTTGTKVEIWNYRSKDRLIGSAVIGDDGQWKTSGELNNQNTEYSLHVEYTAPGASTQSLTRTIIVKAEDRVVLPFTVGTPAEGSAVTLDDYRASDNNGSTIVAGTGETGGKVKVWNYVSKNRIVIRNNAILTVDGNGNWSGVGEFAGNMSYSPYIEYFAPGADLDGEPTEVLTRTFTTIAPTK